MTDLTSSPSGNDAHEAAAADPSAATFVPNQVLKLGRRINAVGDAGHGYASTLGHGFELALTLVVFGSIGWLIDRAAGTDPAFTLALGVLGFVGISLKLWYGYDREMRSHEDGAIWNRPAGAPVAASPAAPEADPS